MTYLYLNSRKSLDLDLRVGSTVLSAESSGLCNLCHINENVMASELSVIAPLLLKVMNIVNNRGDSHSMKIS